MRSTLPALVIFVAALVLPAAAQTPVPAASVREAHGVYTVTAEFSVAESAEIVRAVLTDYERIPKFLPSVEKSVIVTREPGHAVVEQQVAGRMMMFSKRIHLRLDIHEDETSIRFTDLCKRHFSAYDGEWRIEGQGLRTIVRYQLAANPSFAVPGFVLSRALKHDAEQLIGALRTEMTARARR
jgi:ribosome-associated toxin RatA of RatAB toxin-antitoxin module